MPDPRFFTSKEKVSLGVLAKVGGFEVSEAHQDVNVSSVSSLGEATKDTITFLSNMKYLDALSSTKAGACLIKAEYAQNLPEGVVGCIAADPYVAYAKVSAYLHSDIAAVSGVASSAAIAQDATLGKDCTIGEKAVISSGVVVGDNTTIEAGSYIGPNVVIGSGCHIHANVTVTHALIGNEVIVHSGVCIGQDGFGYATDQGQHIKVPQLGRVVIEDRVEIGANSCIDRGAGPDTIIGAGTKIDNLVQIAHNVQTGKGCIIVAQTGISGSSKLGNYVVLGGQVGVVGHVNVGSFVQAAAKAGITTDVDDHTVVGGYPAVPVKQWHRQTVAVKKLVQKKGA